MPNVEPDALDDDPPPRRLVSKSHRAMRERENSANVKPEEVGEKSWENPPLTSILTPPASVDRMSLGAGMDWKGLRKGLGLGLGIYASCAECLFSSRSLLSSLYEVRPTGLFASFSS